HHAAARAAPARRQPGGGHHVHRRRSGRRHPVGELRLAMSATWFPGITPSREVPAEIDTGVAHPARVYDYILGGKNNFAADQAAARNALAANPALATAMRENRAVMRRMTAFL